MFYIPHNRVYTPNTGPSLTKQSFKDECDVNNILRKYQKTGLITHSNPRSGTFDDLPSDIDFQQSMNTIIAAESAFTSLPSSLRRRFNNSPEEFLSFVYDPANTNELIELGLATNKSGPGQSPGDATPAEPAPAEQKTPPEKKA